MRVLCEYYPIDNDSSLKARVLRRREYVAIYLSQPDDPDTSCPKNRLTTRASAAQPRGRRWAIAGRSQPFSSSGLAGITYIYIHMGVPQYSVSYLVAAC